MNSKEEFRDIQIQKLTDFFNTSESKKENEILYKELFSDVDFNNAQTIGLTVSMDFELDTEPIIEKCLTLGKEVYVPKTNPQTKKMSFHKFNGYDNLEKTRFGVFEPISEDDEIDPEILVVPGLAFIDNSHYRLGFGAGFYDRYLAYSESKTISLVNSAQLYYQDQWNTDEFDVPIDKLITSKVDE